MPTDSWGYANVPSNTRRSWVVLAALVIAIVGLIIGASVGGAFVETRWSEAAPHPGCFDDPPADWCR